MRLKFCQGQIVVRPRVSLARAKAHALVIAVDRDKINFDGFIYIARMIPEPEINVGQGKITLALT